MRVFFVCDTKDILIYSDKYLTIRETVLSLGHTLTRDWLLGAIQATKRGEKHAESRYYDKVVEAILVADVVIIEGTVATANISHELTLALQKGRPLLFLSQLPYEELSKGFLSGVDSPLLKIKSYSKDTLKNIVSDFLNNSIGGLKVRFNLVMEKEQDNYLEWAAFIYKKSKTELIKRAIDVIIKNDDRYREYLKKL